MPKFVNACYSRILTPVLATVNSSYNIYKEFCSNGMVDGENYADWPSKSARIAAESLSVSTNASGFRLASSAAVQ